MDIIERLRNGLVVSCQAYGDEAMNDAATMAKVAQAAVAGGAAGVRMQGPAHVAAAREVVQVPVIGLWKDGTDGVFITPTLEHALAVADAGAQVVALDGTRRPRPDGRTLAETVAALKDAHPVAVMADCGSLADAVAAEAAGVDILGTTLAGYTGDRPATQGPDLDLVRDIAGACTTPVLAEGRIHLPQQAAAALAAGAFAVCAGTAITHPTSITGWFVRALDEEDS